MNDEPDVGDPGMGRDQRAGLEQREECGGGNAWYVGQGAGFSSAAVLGALHGMIGDPAALLQKEIGRSSPPNG